MEIVLELYGRIELKLRYPTVPVCVSVAVRGDDVYSSSFVLVMNDYILCKTIKTRNVYPVLDVGPLCPCALAFPSRQRASSTCCPTQWRACVRAWGPPARAKALIPHGIILL